MLITIARFLDPAEAHIVRGRLEAEGIAATVAFANHVTADWPMALALGGVAVQVPADAADAAADILRAYSAGEFAADVDAQIGIDPAACTSCGSTARIARVPATQKALAVVVFLFGGATFPTRQSDLRCAGCGRTVADPA